MECRSSTDQVLIKAQSRVLIEGIDRHSTADAFSTHDSCYLVLLLLDYFVMPVSKNSISSAKLRKFLAH